ncbi:unnamed protein product [Polarella glacialis]|uniref:BTB domain-containing protein n=1 Tax=Polarella glacialis TaxID=89957 RepID=A0A813G8D1_POLGL|nr:unnamed protein product [Polarella glacialis]CAE8622976.1 unnamed protein product [Polarella glacialis]
MAMQSMLANLCPRISDNDDSADLCDWADEPTVLLASNDGKPAIRCHAALLRARCPLLPSGTLVECHETSDVLHGLLRWVYCGTLCHQASDTLFSEVEGPELRVAMVQRQRMSLGSGLLRLAERWGLRDSDCLKGRLVGRRLVQRQQGTLAEDLLRAYDDGQIGGRFLFSCADEDIGGREDLPPLEGGWCALLRLQSSYFDAMLSGGWAESSGSVGSFDGRRVVHLQWPREQLARLLRFFHGDRFVRSSADLPLALECARFFGVPSLFASVNDWIAAHLKIENASALWNLVESEPGLVTTDADFQEVVDDADAACFYFHLKHFEVLAEDEVDASGGVPLNLLNTSLMQRLLMSGLVDIPTAILKGVVKRFARARCSDKQQAEALRVQLQPPAVLFNREHRDALLPRSSEVTVRAFL